MTKQKNTKKALLFSVLSMMLCIAMLVGSTFAWFTDSVTSGVNKIVAGNLDVEMEYAVLNEDGSFKEWKTVDSETSLFDENALWEPGYTQVVYLKISNVGSLSLNYKLSVDVAHEKQGVTLDENGNQVRFNLSDYLKFGTVATDAENFFADRTAAREAIGENAGKLKNYSSIGSIKASEKATDVDYVALVVYMPETVGNEANHISGIDAAAPYIELGIKLEATQMVDENDSFGNDYDKNAFQNNEQTPEGEDAFADMSKDSFEVKTEADLLKFADLVNTGTDFANKTVTLANDITLAQSNWTPVGTETTPFKGTFDGGSHTISGLKITEDTNGNAGFFGVANGAVIQNLTVEGDIVLENNSATNVGGICASANSTTIDRCTNKVKIDASAVTNENGVQVGGIVGMHAGTISNCVNEGNITGSDFAIVGGITSTTSFDSTLSANTNKGTISGAEGQTGKLVGFDFGTNAPID